MNRKSIELEMPEMFPQKHYDGINEILLKKKDVHLPAWKEFAGGWNGLKFRFLSCAESNQSFIQLAKEYGGSPPFPQRYYQERELFNFFVTGFSAVECYFYALYFICFFIDANCFGSAKFGQMMAFLKLQIICDNLKLGEMHDNQSKVQSFA